MRVLVLSHDFSGASLCHRLAREGHEVRVSVSGPRHAVKKALALLLLTQGVCAASPFDAADEARLFNMPLGGDALGMGNATTATWTGLSTDNPAAIGASREAYLSLTTSEVGFSAGPHVRAGELGVTWPLPLGTLDLAIGDTRSSRGRTAGGDDYRIVGDPYITVMYGAEAGRGVLTEGDALYLGVTASPAVGHTRYEFYDSGGIAQRTKTHVRGWGAGALYKPDTVTGIGLSYNEWRLDTRASDLATSTEETENRTLRQWKLGAARSFSNLLVSLEVRRFQGQTDKTSFAFGGEYCPGDGRLCVLSGWNGAGATFGAGIGTNAMGFNIGYARRVASDLSGQFGDSPTVSGTLWRRF